MCGRFVLTTTSDQIQQRFGIDDVPSIVPRYNIAPTQDVLVIRQYGDGSRYAGMLRWRLIPHWAKDSAIGNKMINARSETAHEKPSFRNPIRYHRCLIPASGLSSGCKKTAVLNKLLVLNANKITRFLINHFRLIRWCACVWVRSSNKP